MLAKKTVLRKLHLCTTPEPVLLAFADELECSRTVEQQLRQQMCDAIHAAEAEAHRKVEDSYQEASYAGEMLAASAARGNYQSG